jgi:hypothetical protein
MLISPCKLMASLVLFPIVPILLPLKTDYDNFFPIYMIWLSSLFYKRASYLAVHIVECSSAMLDPSTLATTWACRTQAARFVERDRLARQAIQATNLVFSVGKEPLENDTEYKYLATLCQLTIPIMQLYP